jgi:hypothetical protein
MGSQGLGSEDDDDISQGHLCGRRVKLAERRKKGHGTWKGNGAGEEGTKKGWKGHMEMGEGNDGKGERPILRRTGFSRRTKMRRRRMEGGELEGRRMLWVDEEEAH